MIRENDFLISHYIIHSKSKYILVIEPENVNLEESSWDGMMMEMRKAIES
jgi:hypothetical protein